MALICALVFTYAKSRFSYDVVLMISKYGRAVKQSTIQQKYLYIYEIECYMLFPFSFIVFYRTPVLRWSYVVSNFIQVLGCILYTYYIFERFCVPVFRNFNREHVSAKPLIVAVFSCMLPGTLVLLIGEYFAKKLFLDAIILQKINIHSLIDVS